MGICCCYYCIFCDCYYLIISFEENVKNIIGKYIESIPSFIYLILGVYLIYLLYTNIGNKSLEKSDKNLENKKKDKKLSNYYLF